MNKSTTSDVEVVIHLESAEGSPILFNRRSFMLDILRDPGLKKQKGEEELAHQMRIYKLKAEYEDSPRDKDGIPTGHIMIPGSQIKKILAYSQMTTCHPIAPKGATKRNATLSKVMPAVFVDNIVTKYTAADLDHFDAITCIQNGMKKSSVLSIRPMLKKWEADVSITIGAPDLIDRGMLIEALNWGGVFCGIGDWRPERGGLYGRFLVS